MSRIRRPGLSFVIGTVVGTAGGLIGLGGAEFRLPALVSALRFSAREAVSVNLVASFIVLAAAFPLRAGSVPLAKIVPHLPAVLGMLAGSMFAAWIGAGWLRRTSDKLLGRFILTLLVSLGLVLIVEGLFVAEPTRLVGKGLLATAPCRQPHSGVPAAHGLVDLHMASVALAARAGPVGDFWQAS